MMTDPAPQDARADRLLLLAGLFGAIAVAAGAYASHGLSAIRDARAVELWQMASHYQLIHAVAMVATVLLYRLMPHAGRRLLAAGLAFAIGSVLFPGALYALGWWGPSAMGAVAPLGGLSFIIGWLLVASAAFGRGR
ncbi:MULTISPECIES: DUF423 domain-containing protein [unclassified Azospirillum]|uniref:DUF423 domain-containing protein n=1 Tax=unclassified Azospirillum TaxID=2630922 RepID=UPI00190EF2B7|nr:MULTISPECIES: DUF423 domain-containing protein [unclassified Azospirillum]